MIILVTILHVFVCIFLILVILLQAGKGGGMGAGLGGGAQAVFGSRGSQTLLGKVTSVSAAMFVLTSLTLAYHSSQSTSVVARDAQAPAPAAPAQQQPATPAQQQPAAPAQPQPATPAQP